MQPRLRGRVQMRGLGMSAIVGVAHRRGRIDGRGRAVMPAEGVAVLLVDNGPRNFITWSVNDELEAVLNEIANDVAVVGDPTSVCGSGSSSTPVHL
jgi:hypothetical protein